MVAFTKMQGVGNDFVLIDGRAYPGLDGERLAPSICDRRFGVGADGLLIVEPSAQADAAMHMFNPDGTPDMCGNGLRCVARYLADHPDTHSSSLIPGRPGHEGGASPTPARRRRFAPLTPARRRRFAPLAPTSAPPASLVPDPHEAGWAQQAAPLQGLRTHPSSLTIATLAGRREATVRYAADGACAVTVGMGQPQFAPEAIPMRVSAPRVVDYPLDVDGETFVVTALSTGTTHTVLFVNALPDDETFLRVSPRIENHPLFPERTSVMWTRRDSDTRLALRIWERAAGETWGCGTGACAAAVAARLHGCAEEDVTVASKGGELLIHWREGEEIRMTGPAEYVFEGVYPV